MSPKHKTNENMKAELTKRRLERSTSRVASSASYYRTETMRSGVWHWN
jgi:hypothetical protein